MSYKGVAATGIVLVIILVVLGLVIYGFMGIGERRAESQYTGHVVDVVEDKGLIFTPSWINMKTNPRSSDIQEYCVHPSDEERLLPELYDAMEEGHRVTVTYDRPFWVSPQECSGNQAILKDIRVVNESVYDT